MATAMFATGTRTCHDKRVGYVTGESSRWLAALKLGNSWRALGAVGAVARGTAWL